VTFRNYVLALPPGLKLLNANQRIHYRVRAEQTAAIRSAAFNACSEHPQLRADLATAGQAPVLPHAWILGVIHPGSRRRLDPANLYPSFKAAVDGIVEAGVLEDDDHTHLLGPDMRLGTVVRGGQLVLHIYEMTPEAMRPGTWAAATPILSPVAVTSSSYALVPDAPAPEGTR
jgi:crossover junction endodeoxyribonuclease RusA